MGTLTADEPQLDEHCPHKLPTSCRLTSTPQCCACADRRQHFSTYSVYIDGVGFVPRGTRWQSYCWFCKEFWDNRLATTDPPMRPNDTKIPQVPDQTEFLSRWFEFHRGYRIVKQEDGTDIRIAVLGEPFKDVSPGQLPRTLEELRNGSQPANSASRSYDTTHPGTSRQDEPQQSLDDALDELLEEAEREDPPSIEERPRDRPLAELPVEVKRHLALVLSAANTLQSRIGRFLQPFSDATRRDSPSLASLNSLIPTARSLLSDIYTLEQKINEIPTSDTFHPGGRSFGALDNIRAHLLNALSTVKSSTQDANGGLTIMANRFHNITTNLETSHSHIRSLREHLSRTTRQLRTAENFARVFGTLEDVQQEDYQSPLGVMFSRAYGRYHAAEEARQRLQNGMTLVPSTDDPQAGLWGVPVPANQPPVDAELQTTAPAAPPGDAELAMQLFQPGTVPFRRDGERETDVRPDAVRPLGLDGDDRPPPLQDEELVVKLECRICFTQRSSVALLPCGHLVMCRWCADQSLPTTGQAGGILRRNAECPLCRRRAKRRVDVYLS